MICIGCYDQRMMGHQIIISIVLLLFLFSGPVSGANDPTQGRVGWMETVEGEVAIRVPADGRAGGAPRSGTWSETVGNDPVASGMAVRTTGTARAVLRIGGDLVAFADDSEADLVKLDRAGTMIALRRGRLGMRLSEFDARRQIEIALSSGTLHLSAPGEYDITAGDEKSSARVAVFAGAARIAGNGINAVIASGGAVLLSVGESVPILPGGTDQDAFGEWWRGQRHDAADSPTLRHVPVALTGHEALDLYGAWESVAGIGAVWFPNDPPGDWAPYRYGRWRWIAPWGWTWIDDAKWGFATSHYGRWANIGGSDSETGRWGWVPGERVEEPVFMPAAVAFLGTAGVGLSYPDAFSPAVAWFPLAPGEIYWPSFTDDPDAIQRLNAGAGADLAAIGAALRGDPPPEIVIGEYRNRRHASVVPRAVFVGGRPVAEAVIDLPKHRLENAPLLAGSPGIKPAVANPPPKPPANPGMAATVARAPDTLARIIKSRGQKTRTVTRVVSQKPVLKTSGTEKRAAKPPAVKKNAKERAVRARLATVSKQRSSQAEKKGKPTRSHATERRRPEAAGG